MIRTEAINELAAALAQAQAEIAHAKKESENPHFRHRYADLASIWDACRGALTAHGLAVMQSPRLVAGEVWLVEVETLLLHQSGQAISDVLAVPVNPASAQAVGAAITYARRYALAAFVGVAPDADDDAHAGSGPLDLRTARDVAADRFPEKPTLETVRVQVLGIVKRPGKAGGEQFILTADDQHTYATATEAYASIAKVAKQAGRPVAIDYRATAAGREIVRLYAEAEP